MSDAGHFTLTAAQARLFEGLALCDTEADGEAFAERAILERLRSTVGEPPHTDEQVTEAALAFMADLDAVTIHIHLLAAQRGPEIH